MRIRRSMNGSRQLESNCRTTRSTIAALAAAFPMVNQSTWQWSTPAFVEKRIVERYRVYSASIYHSKKTDRSYGLIGAERIESESIEETSECSDHCERPTQITITSGRNVWGEDNQLTNRRIFITAVPSFPIGELIGKIIKPCFTSRDVQT